MKKILVLICAAVFAAACAGPPQAGQTAGEPRGLQRVGTGLVNLVLSPLQIAVGLLEGISAVPYYLAMGLKEINDGLIAANAQVTLDDTYEYAYGKRIAAVPEDGDTGETFRRMKHATEYFQKILARYGVKDPQHYILTSIDTANNMGFTLFAVVYRPYDTIAVIDKYDGKTPRTFQREDRLYYEPFEKNAQGELLDAVVDWAGMEREFILTQKAQAIMLTLAANQVVAGKKSPDYWDVEKRWIAGEYRSIVAQKMTSIKNKMKL